MRAAALFCALALGVRAAGGACAVHTLAGNISGFADGAAACARFRSPADIALSADERVLIVADQGNHRLRAVDLSSGVVSTIAGTGVAGTAATCVPPMYCDGPARCANLTLPTGLALNVSSGVVYFTELNPSQRVRALADGVVRTVAGAPCNGGSFCDGVGTNAGFFRPIAVALMGAHLFVSDTNNCLIRLIRFAGDGSAVVSTLSGIEWHRAAM